MNLKELKAIVARRESEWTEFKRSTGQRSEAAKTVCALANGLGGFVIFGITDKGEIVNTRTLHFDITPEKLAQPHQSRPWNPIIASVFCRVGIIEQWGTGTLKVIDWCRDNANPTPIWQEQSGSVVITFRPAPGFAAETTPQVTPQVTEEVARLLAVARTPRSRQELLRDLGLNDRERFRKAYLLPALESGLLERAIPDKPQSSKQQYRLTSKGEAWLRQQGRP